MKEILIIRFGALGDLCLLGWTLARLTTAPDSAGCRVTLVTKERLADLAAHLRGVDEVVSLREPGGLRSLVRLARSLRQRKFSTVIDAHCILRSRLLLGMLGRRPNASLRKDTLARLLLLRRSGAPDPSLQRHMRDRFDALLIDASLLDARSSNLTLLSPRPPLADLAAPAAPAAILGLAPGAQWNSKRWPLAHWVDLVRRYRAVSTEPLRVFLGPRETSWFAGSELAAALGNGHTADGPIEIVRNRPLPEAASLLGGCRLLVCNDSGLMHLAEAVGTPVVACFGPTVAAFGYTPHLPGSAVLEIDDLDCRPCSRNGKRPCHRQDLACLSRITPARVWRAVCARGPWPED